MELPRVILASASPRRTELLRELGLKFQVIVSQAAESHPAHLTPLETAQLNSRRKAVAVARLHPDRLVIGADTVVCLDNVIFGKPRNLAGARAMLGQLQGKSHQVITGVCLAHYLSGRERLFAESTEVVFRPLSPEQIDHYLHRINPLDKAGAYAIQEHGEMIAAQTKGSFSNVVGLPVERLRMELAAWLNSANRAA